MAKSAPDHMLTLYGIKNCDKVQRARKWLADHGHEYVFHDYRVDGIDSRLVNEIVENLGWEKIINRRSTTWRRLADSDRAGLNETNAKQLMIEHPTLIKRPLFQYKQRFIADFPENFL